MGNYLITILMFISGLNLFAQTEKPYLFVGKGVLLSEQINSSNIHFLDSSSFRLDLQFDNYYNINEIKEYRVGILKGISNSILKLNYIHFQENIFTNNQFKVGVQKRLSNRLIGNIGIALNIKLFREITTNITTGMSLNYRLTNRLFIHSFVDNIGFSPEDRGYELISGIIYKVDDNLGFFCQLESRDEFDFAIGGALTIKKIKVQLVHIVLQESLRMSFKYYSPSYTIAFSYAHHPILNQNVTVLIGFNL